jgi:pimeloyl-ACP methyl ester carboxylesterase
MRDRILKTADGREVGFWDFGSPGQTPVLWCHGGPGCRLEPAYAAEAASRTGLRLIGIDRPGYGRSTPQPGRTIGGWVGDALTVADELRLEQFATVGISTGGAYALAVAAKSPRVIGAVACCAVTDMRWAEGKAMMPANERIWSAPSREVALEIAEEMLGAGGANVAGLEAMPLAPSDRELFADPAWMRYWSAVVPEMVAQGAVGFADDRIADGDGWHTFDVRGIECPVVVLHGTSDTFAPVAHAHHTQRIVPGASLDTRDGLGHFSIFSAIAPVLQQMLAGERRAA